MKDFTFCPVCAEPLEWINDEGRGRLACRQCGFVQYRNPAPAAGVVVEDGRGVLLVRRRYDPYRGRWTIPAGFVEYGEDVRSTAVREVREETGLEVELGPVHAVESCFDDPRGNALLVLFRGRIIGGELAANDDAEEAGFFPLDQLPPIAFEAHRKVLEELSRATREAAR